MYAGWLSGWKWPAKPDCTDEDDCPNDINGNSIQCGSAGYCEPGDSLSDNCRGGDPASCIITPVPHGRYPTAAEGVVDMVVCFDTSPMDSNGSCDSYVEAGVKRCEEGGKDFLLFRLPYTSKCSAGYCTAPSGL